MVLFSCEKCGWTIDVHVSTKHQADRNMKCRCGGRLAPYAEKMPNEMRDMDNELGRDE